MGSHSGTGTAWDENSPDVDQPHGNDYLEHQDLRKGIRKRLQQEHVTPAGATVGGVHIPGKVSVVDFLDATADVSNYFDDGSYTGPGLVYCASTGNNYGVLFLCSTTDGTYTGASGDPTVLKLHPDLQWGGGDITWAGAQEFDASVDISTALYVDGTCEVLNELACASNLVVSGDFCADGTADFGGNVAFVADVSADSSVVCGAGLMVEGTAVFAAEVDVSGNMDVSGDIRHTGDASGSQFPAAWGMADWTTSTINASYNIGNVDWSSVGIACVSFSNNLASANYVVILTAADDTVTVNDLSNNLTCISRTTSGFRVAQENNAGSVVDTLDQFSFVVFI
jgi:hypothetical protein